MWEGLLWLIVLITLTIILVDVILGLISLMVGGGRGWGGGIGPLW